MRTGDRSGTSAGRRDAPGTGAVRTGDVRAGDVRAGDVRAGAAAPAPLVVTLALDPEAQEPFDRLRAEHFPAGRNHLRAHVTLFHALPGHERAAVLEDLADVARRPPPAVRVTGVMFLGRGVAYRLDSPAASAVHAELARRWDAWLTPQDRQPFRPHVTVQNKVAPERARTLHTQLAAQFVPSDVTAVGLALWRYLGGPWEHVETAAFDPARPAR